MLLLVCSFAIRLALEMELRGEVETKVMMSSMRSKPLQLVWALASRGVIFRKP